MRIIHVIDNMNIGGGQKLVHDLAIVQKNNGHNVSVVSICRTNNFFTDNLLHIGVDVICLYKNKRSLYNPLVMWKLRSVLNEADLVHVHLFPANYWCALYKIFLNNKIVLVTTEHNTNNKRRAKWYLRGLEKCIYHQFDAIVGCSSKATMNISDFLNTSKPLTIENGVDIEKYGRATPYTKEELLGLSNSEEKIVLMMVARFRHPKDQRTIINSLLRLDEEYVAVFVGDGEELTNLRQYAISLGLKDRCFFLGIRKDVDRLVNSADINILSSEWEGLPLSTVECLSAGKPFIGTNVQGIKEIVENAGLLFEYKDDSGLATQIKMLMSDKEFYDSVAEKCKTRSRQFDINKCYQLYQNLYVGLLSK